MSRFTRDSPQISASPYQLNLAPYASEPYNAQWNAPGLLRDKHTLRSSRILGEMEVDEPWLGLWLPLNYQVDMGASQRRTLELGHSTGFSFILTLFICPSFLIRPSRMTKFASFQTHIDPFTGKDQIRKALKAFTFSCTSSALPITLALAQMTMFLFLIVSSRFLTMSMSSRFLRMNDNITLVLHHGGRFTPRASDGKVEYIGREFDVWEDISADCLNAFILYDLVKACKKYSNIGECFWLIDKDLDFNHGLRSCTTDGDILHLVRDAFENENEINVYFHREVDPILEEVPQMLYLECDPIRKAVENEDDIDDVPVAVHEEDVGAGEQRDAGEQMDAGKQRDGGEQRDTDAGEQRDGTGEERDAGGEERDVADSEEEKEVDSDETDAEWFINFSCMLNEVEAEVEIDGYHSEELNIPISSEDEDEDVEVYPQYSQSSGVGEQKLELGMEFGTLDEFKSALREYSILMGREFKAKCKKAFCDWEIYCAKNEVRNSFQIKTFKHNHNCCREVNNKQANRQWVVSKLEGKLRLQPTLKCVEALEYFKQEFGVHIEVTKMWRAMKEAKQLVEGNERKQYAKVFDYAHELLRSNPGSTAKISTVPSPEGPPQFQRLYICLAGCKKGFVAGCRPFIGLDGCFLKSAFGGNLLSAVGLDGNNHIYVIAYVVVDIENKRQLEMNGWNFMSDMQKGLIPALQEVMPGAPHRFCVLHLWKNFTKQWKSKELKGIVWQCAKSTTVAEFEGHMAHLKTINCQAWEYLNKWPKQARTKAHFSTIPKVYNICNNTCEVFNSRILQYRCKPIITMLEEIRSYIMRTMAAHKVKLSGKPGPLCLVQYKRLEKEFHFANQWTPIWCGDNMGLRYEVHMWGNKVEVNLGEWTCTCGVWQLTGMPCRHAIATITHKGGKPEDMCHEWLSIEAYNKTYQHFIESVQGPQYWAQTQYTHPVPPHKRVQRGRPKKNRRRSVDEDNVTGHKLKRKLAEFTCGRCGQTNHNIRSCKNIGVPVRPKKYVAPSTSNEDDHLLSQDEQALNEAEEAAAHVQQDPVEINLSQPHLSQDSDMELMVPATIVPPIARNKLTITRAKQRKVAEFEAARLPWWHCRMKLPENAQQLPLADMDKSSEQAAATEPQSRRRRSNSAWEEEEEEATSSFVNPNFFGEEEATLRVRENL
ncbi:hypothetical protein GmHk_05G012964 [Glycine max]|nr:hypothetical protein GmHk_05G012964 [Glycine max]